MRIKIVVLFLCSLASSLVVAADYQASLDWSNRVELSMLVSGVVEKVHVKEGQSVSKGDLLLQLDERDFAYRSNSAKAIHNRSEANYQEAVREHERAKELYDRRLLSDHELQLKKIALVEAQSSMDRSKADMQLASLSQERSQLKAPFDGQVISVLVHEGESVLNRLQLRPMIILVSKGQMVAVAKVASKAAAKLSEGMSASVGVRGDWMIGSVLQVGNEAVQVTDKDSFYLLTAVFSPGETRLRAGEKATIRIKE